MVSKMTPENKTLEPEKSLDIDIQEIVNTKRKIYPSKTQYHILERINYPTFSLWAKGFDVDVWCLTCKKLLLSWGYHINNVMIWHRENCEHFEIKLFPRSQLGVLSEYYDSKKKTVYQLEASERYLIVSR